MGWIEAPGCHTRHVTRRRLIIAALGLCLLGWVAWSSWTLWQAGERARSGLDRLEELGELSGSSPAELVDLVSEGDSDALESGIVPELRLAAADFSAADEGASAPWMKPWEYVPVVGTQLRSVQALSAAAETVADASSTTFDEVDAALDGSFTDPRARTAAVRAVGESLLELQAEIEGLDLGPLEKLLPPLAEARDRFAAELGSLQEALEEAAPAAIGTADFLEGPSTYLFMAANNAEMRAGSGMLLQAGEIRISGGSFAFGELRPTEGMVLSAPGTVLDPDVAANWSWLSPDREFRNVNLTPRFEESARMASEMWTASGGSTPEGVMVADVFALQSLLEVVGPVEVPGDGEVPALTVTSQDVVRLLLFDQYVLFEEDRPSRRDLVGRVASSVLDALNTRDVPPLELMEAIDSVVAGRHLLLWSADPDQEAAFQAIGADGSLRGDDLGVAMINRGGDKLDQFLDASVTVTPTGEPTGGRQSYRMDVHLSNTAPEGLPRYVGGPHPNSTQPEGTWQGIVSVTLPAAARQMQTEAPLVVFGNDGPSRVVGMAAIVPRGGQAALSLGFDLPVDSTNVRLLASARPRPTSWFLPGAGVAFETTDARSRLVDLGAGT